MKKIFTLLTALAVIFSVSAAKKEYLVKGPSTGTLTAGQVISADGDPVTITSIFAAGKNKDVTTGKFVDGYTGQYFTKASAKLRLSGAPTLDVPDGTENSGNSALKMDVSSTLDSLKVYFEAASAARKMTLFNRETGAKTEVTALQGSDKIGGSNLGFIAVFENVQPGSYTVYNTGYGAGLIGIRYILDDGPVIPALATPEIAFDAATGEVTITSADNAPVYYTTDGTAPTADGTLYTAPFTVADNTVVKAASFGDGENNLDSKVAEATVLLSGLTVADPVIKSVNGTFHISTATPAATIYYSLDGGEYKSLKGNKGNVTLLESATVTAYATRENCTQSATVTAEVTALPAVKADKTVLLGYGSFTVNGQVLTVKGGDAAEGYVSTLTLINDDTSKTWGTGSYKLTMTHTDTGTGMGKETRTAIKGSNASPTKVTMAPGYKAVRVTLYSVINVASDVDCGWKEVNGVDYSASVSEVPMTAFANDIATPDARIFNFDEPVDEFTFTNAGRQVVFVLAVDVVEVPVELPSHNLGDSNTITLTEDTPISFDHADANAEIWYRLTPHTPAAAVAEEGEGDVVTEEPAEVEFVKYDAEAKPVFKLSEGHKLLEYYAVVNGRKSEVKSVVLYSGDPSGISTVAADILDVNAPIYNVLGQKVTPDYKGILIQNGKKYINR